MHDVEDFTGIIVICMHCIHHAIASADSEEIPKVSSELEVSCDHRIRLCTNNPEELRSDYLYKLLPSILNPAGMDIVILYSVHMI